MSGSDSGPARAGSAGGATNPGARQEQEPATYYWYRPAWRYLNADGESYVIAGSNTTAVERFAWEEAEARYTDCEEFWVERLPMDAWERVPDRAPGRPRSSEGPSLVRDQEEGQDGS